MLARFIDTIVVFKGENRPLPYKFRYKDDQGGVRELFVDKILLVTEQKVAGVTSLLYECQSEVDGEERRYQLRYIVPQCKWMIYKF